MSTSNDGEKINVLLFGLGAIGGFYAFILSKNPNVSLSVIARSNYEAVKQNGLHITSALHGTHTIKPTNVFQTPSDATPLKFAYIILAHKAINPSTIPPLFKTCVSDSTTFVIIQNGVGNEDPFRSTFPANTIISCVTWTGAVQTSPGVIEHGKNEDMQIGLFPNATLPTNIEQDRLKTFAHLLTTGGTKFNIESNVQLKRWEKVIWNAAWNPLTTLTGTSVQSYLRSSPAATQTAKSLMREVLLVGQTLGIPLADSLPDELVEKVLDMPGEVFSSMYQDRREGRALEKEVILGVPLRRAGELGLEGRVPVLRAIWSMIDMVDRGITGV
ncbi:hypothetical protein M409DRAFT_55750 [Zasmidium cellare ATCC 36951]|uniref:2-dehydropantoate 2-reductase n=1 Tax=Zasmidium cellare ATCC 36951 TaxID=1080233 RepID=A0A6A6CIU8_ZASCE|nr:uncharacterized protein M409DRAFT_55750 [Zasmidium cellare ATCC 36951]KAF2165336.1 hypothetical protein M409DRAFT_55750 [Zasmidium cellare ATCC 36951]